MISPIFTNIFAVNSPDFFGIIFKEIFKTNTYSATYKIEIKMNERLIPLITNNDGTVSKYKIEIFAEFNLTDLDGQEIIHSNFARGFNSYNVVSSEYNTEENKKIALKQATREALQILITKIQNHITKIS